MNLREDLPEKVQEKVKANSAGARVEMALKLDLDKEGNFIEGWTVVTADKILILLKQDEEIVLQDSYLLEKINEFSVESKTGNNLLEADIDGEKVVLLRFTESLKATYLAAVKVLNQYLKKGKIAALPEETIERCPDCGRVYPDESKVCPACVNKWQTAARLWSILKPHLKLLIITMGLFWLITGVSLFLPQLQRILVDDVLVTDQGGSLNLLLILLAAMIFLRVVSMGLTILRRRVMTKLSSILGKDLRQQVYSKMQELSLRFLSARKTGELMNRVTGDTGTLQRFLQYHAGDFLNEIILFCGVFVILLFINWRMTFLVILPAPLVILINGLLIKIIRKMFRRQKKSWDKANSLLQDILNGIRVVKAFGQEKHEIERFNEKNRQLRDITISNEQTFSTIFPIIGFLMNISHFLIFYYGGNLVLGESLSLGELIMFTSYAGMIYQPLAYMSQIPRWYNDAMAAAERIFNVIDQKSDVMEKADAVTMDNIKGEISIKNVGFAYEKHEAVLEDISLTVEPGEMIGLVGHSGAGKSTLINLICRFYDVDRGELLIDGVNIKDITLKSLRSQIGVVLQDTFLFNDTVWANISYARPDSSPEEIIRAAKLANAHDFIIKMTDGYDSIVGEKGQNLSGGQRQRIAIARALLHNPRILILDEPTSSVDTNTEEKIQQALERLMEDRTTFAIAHRLGTLKNATRLMVLDHGRSVELGTHKELMEKKGVYFGLVMAQREMSRSKAVGG